MSVWDERRRAAREPDPRGQRAGALIGALLVVAALGLSLGVQALMADARQAAMVLLGVGVLASAVAGIWGIRLLRG